MDTTSNLDSKFSDVCAVRPTGDGTWTADIDPRWTIMGNPNGGYLQAVMTEAATALSPQHPHPLAVSTHFLRSPRPGPVGITAELLRTGRTTAQVRVRMSQAGRPTGETTVTLGTLGAGPEVEWTASDRPPAPHPRGDCTRYRAAPGDPEVAVYEEVGLYLEPGQTAFTTGQCRGTGTVRAWVELPGAADFTPGALLLAADVLPPATLDIRRSGWVPTLELTTYLRALPAPGPVNVLLSATVLRDGMVDETATVWDSAGVVVAQSHQLAAVLS